MELRKTFVKSDKFVNLANVEIAPNKLKTLLAILGELKIPLNANEELDYNSISFKLTANIAGKTPQLFARSLLDFIIDLYTANNSESKTFLQSVLSEDYFPPTVRSIKLAQAITHSIKFILPFCLVNIDNINFNYGFPFTAPLNLEISTPQGKECEFSIYILTREYLGETPFITLHRRPQKALSEISVEFTDIQKLIYFIEGNLDSENADVYDLYTNEEKLSNVLNSRIVVPTVPGSTLPKITFSELVFFKNESIRLVMNLATSITADRYFLYRKVSNAYQIPKIQPIVAPIL